MYARDEAVIATPIGTARLLSNGFSLSSVTLTHNTDLSRPASAILIETELQLNQWFAGERRVFTVPLTPLTTPRGQALRDAILAVGFGETTNYGALARHVASGARAIGQACARNPLPIIVPCHRILAAQGRLGAYSAGDGPTTKQWLLDFERGHCPGQTLLI